MYVCILTCNHNRHPHLSGEQSMEHQKDAMKTTAPHTYSYPSASGEIAACSDAAQEDKEDSHSYIPTYMHTVQQYGNSDAALSS